MVITTDDLLGLDGNGVITAQPNEESAQVAIVSAHRVLAFEVLTIVTDDFA